MIIRLSRITPGSAKVRAFVPAGTGAAFGFSTPLGTVLRQADGRWLVLNDEMALIGAHFPTRKAAVDHLVKVAQEKQQIA